jgi:hypothetical protein
VLAQFRLLRLRFGLEVSTAANLPVFKGDMLRRALLWQLGAMWCRRRERCAHGCEAPDVCLFGGLLEPVAQPTWAEPIRRLMGSPPPPAYVLWDEQDRRREVLPGDSFGFEIALLGNAAIRQFPAFVAALLVAAEQGIGEPRLKGRVQRVDLLTGMHSEARPLLIRSAWQGNPADETFVKYVDAQAWSTEVAPATGTPVTRLHLRFQSPLRVEMRGETVRQPHFAPLARAIVRRLRILSQAHGAGEWPQAEYGPLLDLADTVRLDHHETTWVSTSRHSQRGEMPLEGFVGQAWYSATADLRPLLPALWLGQWVHVGKAAVWGNGRYEVGVI